MIFSRIDHCLDDQSWLSKYNVCPKVLGMNVSDHVPILLNVEDTMVHRKGILNSLTYLLTMLISFLQL